MGKNKRLDWIKESMPDYERVRHEFYEHYYLFLRMGVVNYAALGHHTGFASPSHEIAGVFLAGLAIGRIAEISERDNFDLYKLKPELTGFEVDFAWSLIEEELEAIRPGVKKEGAE